MPAGDGDRRLTLFVPDAMLRAVLPAPPRHRLRLPGRKGEVEEVIERLALAHLPGAFRRWRGGGRPSLGGHRGLASNPSSMALYQC